jgi:hypothetical protein
MIQNMTSETLKSFLRRLPFEPLRIKLSSGESFEVRHPEMALLTKGGLIICLPDEDGEPSNQIEFCSFLHIASVETASFA